MIARTRPVPGMVMFCRKEVEKEAARIARSNAALTALTSAPVTGAVSEADDLGQSCGAVGQGWRGGEGAGAITARGRQGRASQRSSWTVQHPCTASWSAGQRCGPPCSGVPGACSDPTHSMCCSPCQPPTHISTVARVSGVAPLQAVGDAIREDAQRAVVARARHVDRESREAHCIRVCRRAADQMQGDLASGAAAGRRGGRGRSRSGMAKCGGARPTPTTATQGARRAGGWWAGDHASPCPQRRLASTLKAHTGLNQPRAVRCGSSRQLGQRQRISGSSTARWGPPTNFPARRAHAG